MPSKQCIVERLNSIANAVAASQHALALIGLGSAGRELDRLDEYSDLDFFVIVEDGFKQSYLDDLDWLAVAPLVYRFRNTVDGYKVLFEDAVFCEFAVFEAAELEHIPFAPGRIIWKREEVDEGIATPQNFHPPEPASADWLLGEILTGLYVGLCRYWRGEKLAAARLVQYTALEHLLQLHALTAQAVSTGRDPFANERRLEQRYPELVPVLPSFLQGYSDTPQSALAMLDYLSAGHAVNAAMDTAIRALCHGEHGEHSRG